jgi:diguanylate cyclase (GGDEF)-like protein
MFLAYAYPFMVIPYPDALSAFIDLCVAVSLVGGIMAVIAYTTFNGYHKERVNSDGLLIELEQRNKELEYLSVRDPLTGIYTRRYFMEKLQEQIEFMMGEEKQLYVMMVDVDFFKAVNDNHGHLYGDEVLIKIATTIGATIRSFDILARYGGEEFIILVTHLKGEDSTGIAERVRKAVENISYRYGETITVSIGLTDYHRGDSITTIVNRADECLYTAKENGRNCVESVLYTLPEQGQLAKSIVK